MTVNVKYTIFKILWIALLLSVICDFSLKNFPKPSVVGVIYVMVLPLIIPWSKIIQPFRKTSERMMTLTLLALLASMYISSFFSAYRTLALDSTIFRFTLFYLCFLCTLIYTYYFNKSIHFLIESLIAINLLVAASSILDFYIPAFNRFLMDYFGHWDIKHSNLKLDGVKYMRPSGFITDTNLTAFSVVISCLLLLLNEKKIRFGWFKYIFYGISGYSFGMLASRSALMALIFSVAVFFFTKKIERKRIYVFLLAFFLVQLATPQTLSRIRQVFERRYVEEDVTVGRLVLWKAAFRA